MPFTIEPVMSRTQLQNLKTELSETKQNLSLRDAERIDTYVCSIYRKVLDVAENTTERICINKLYSEYYTFYVEYSEEIMESLRKRLPGCSIEKKTLIYGVNGILHESNNPLYVDQVKNAHVVIDWS